MFYLTSIGLFIAICVLAGITLIGIGLIYLTLWSAMQVAKLGGKAWVVWPLALIVILILALLWWVLMF